MKLSEQKCAPCQAGTPPLSREQAEEMLEETPGWTHRNGAIERDFEFADFREAIAFINEVADIAEDEGHHPDISVYYNKVHLKLTTHKIDGLSQNDFIMAAKINELA